MDKRSEALPRRPWSTARSHCSKSECAARGTAMNDAPTTRSTLEQSGSSETPGIRDLRSVTPESRSRVIVGARGSSGDGDGQDE